VKARVRNSTEIPSQGTGNSDEGTLKKREKKSKSTKVRESWRLLVLGEDIKLDEVMDTVDFVLVWRVHGRNYTTVHMKKWVT